MISGIREIFKDGYAIVESAVSLSEVDSLTVSVSSFSRRQNRRAKGGVRNLLGLPSVSQVANSLSIRSLVEPVLGESAFPVRATLFDKTPGANWKVPWHQDLSIAVQARIDVDGFGPWSIKAGVVHVQPPASVLETMLAVRIHLEDCGEESGPLRVIPGSHQQGRLSAEQVQTIVGMATSVNCPVRCGGALLLRPLLLHASSASTSPMHRRVIHVDFASTELPAGLKWFTDQTPL